jgi:hypothetical protein
MDNAKITSRRRQEASRLNGALSHGPVTPEGKAISSRNAVTHGCLAALITLTPEQAEVFNGIHAEYIARFEPRDQVEHDLVEEIAYAKWQIRLAWIYQCSLHGLQQAQEAAEVSRRWKSLGVYDTQALALDSSLHKGHTILNLQRYARSLRSQSERNVKLLQEMKKQLLPPQDETGPELLEPEGRNEPSPISAQPAARSIHAYVTWPAGPRALPEFVPAPLKTAAAGASCSPPSPDKMSFSL